MVKEALKDLITAIENDGDRIKTYNIIFNDDGSIDVKVNEKVNEKTEKHFTEEEFRDVKHLALIQCGFGEELIKITAVLNDFMNEAEHEETTTDKDVQGTVNDFLCRVSKIVDAPYYFQVIKR